VKAKTGIDLTHFVVPSGDQAYLAPAFANGMLSVNANNSTYRGAPNGYRIDQPIDFDNFRLYKMLVSDANQNTGNIMQKIENAAALSSNGQHYWWSDFTHHVGFQSSGASLLFPLFEYYMQHIADTYGRAGADNIWMAPMQDVYEYLSVRDLTVMNYSIAGNLLTITLDYSAVPQNLRTRALTLSIGSDQDFTSVVAGGATCQSFNGSGDKKIINLLWGSPASKSGQVTGKVTPAEIQNRKPAELLAWPNPFTNQLTVSFTEPFSGETEIQLIDLLGKTVWSEIINPASGNMRFNFNLSGAALKPGVYFMKSINQQGELTSVKILKI